jgi:hypothetical protein
MHHRCRAVVAMQAGQAEHIPISPGAGEVR